MWLVGADGGEPRQLAQGDASLPSWSPTGARIAFGVRFSTTDRRADIVTIPATGGISVPVTQDDHLDWNPVWAPDGRRLYFVSDRGGSTNIWRVAIDEASGRPLGEPEAIRSPAPFAAHLTIAADGRRLAYSSILETQNINKMVLNPSTAEIEGEPVPVTTGSRFWANPDPSPDGQSVVAYSQVNPEGDLYLFRTDGSGAARQLTCDRAIDRVPRWSPDGARIAAFSDRSGSLQVWTIRPDGSVLQQMTTAEGAAIVAWPPDASALAVTISHQSGAVAPADGSAVIVDANEAGDRRPVDRLPPAPGPDTRLLPNSWSPDGRWIVGQSWYGVPGFSVFDVRARTYQRIAEFGEWSVWLPDSRRVLFVSRGREFHVLDVASRQTKRIFAVLRDTLGPPRLTRDGRAAFFSRRITESDVWLVNLQ